MRSSNRSDASFIVKLLRNTFLILMAVVFVSIIYKFNHRESDTDVALTADATAAQGFRGVFFREETRKTYSGEGVLSYSVADGGKLGIGTVIARAYPTDRQISINREISQLEKELDILKKIENPGTLESAQPASLSARIDENYRRLIYSRDIKDYSGVKNIMDDLLVDMSTYQIITNEVTSFKQQITDLNKEISELKTDSAEPTETITSDRSAYFVSYCDGYEEVLTFNKLKEITIAELNSVMERKSDDPTVVGKLIDGYGWYIAGVIDNSRKEYSIGEQVGLRFESSTEIYDAEISDIRDEGDPSRSIFIIQCSQFNADLVEHRVAQCELIKGSYHGLKVPRKAIRFADIEETSADPETGEETSTVMNYKGVYILKGEQVEFKKIDVIYEGSDYVLSRIHDEDLSYLALYDNILTEGVDPDG